MYAAQMYLLHSLQTKGRGWLVSIVEGGGGGLACKVIECHEGGAWLARSLQGKGLDIRRSNVSSPSIANSGPWKQIQKFKAESVGSEDMDDPGMLLVYPQALEVGL